jgi:hypothetical protein
MQRRVDSILEHMEHALAALKESALRARAPYAADLERLKAAGAFPDLARRFAVAEARLSQNGIELLSESGTTLCRYYCRAGSGSALDPVIRVSEHPKGYDAGKPAVDIIVTPDMTDYRVRKLVDQAVRELDELRREACVRSFGDQWPGLDS